MVNISIEDYSETQKAMFFKENGKNRWNLICLMGFEDEFDYYGLKIERKKINDEIGFVFDSSDEEMIRMEAERFVSGHKI